MSVAKGYGRFAAVVNSLLVVLLCHAAAHAQNVPIKIAMLGDSLTAGYGVKADQAIPVRLQAALKAEGRNVTVLNHGVSGDTTAGGLDRVDWMLADKPDIVMVALGGNDALRAIDPATTERNLDAILAKLKEAKVPASGRNTSRPSTGSTGRWRTSTRCRSIPSSSTAWPKTPRSTSPTASIPLPKGSKSS
jgi:acyl-CoA thioesterase-1